TRIVVSFYLVLNNNPVVSQPLEYPEAKDFELKTEREEVKLRLQDVKIYPTLTTLRLDTIGENRFIRPATICIWRTRKAIVLNIYGVL
ncbi:hypothetical protein, partial [Paenibacillus tyrfis]|uniref:hypothetical protein n=1 Tax=Paenibacillus tyrfis TaxID=1501230 RepID=UPI00209C7B5A